MKSSDQFLDILDFRGLAEEGVALSYSIRDKTQQFSTTIPTRFYPQVSAALLFIGFLMTAWFFIYEVTTSKFEKSNVKQLATAAITSVVLGNGILFLMLSAGLYV